MKFEVKKRFVNIYSKEDTINRGNEVMLGIEMLGKQRAITRSITDNTLMKLHMYNHTMVKYTQYKLNFI